MAMHNYTTGVYNHGHAQSTKLTEEQLIQTEQFRKSHVPPRNILRFFQEQNVGCAISVEKIYNVVDKIKKNRIQGQNTVEEVLCLSAQQGYTVFYRNYDDNNVLSDILWFSTCHGDLDTVFFNIDSLLNIDSLIESKIADIKSSLEYSRVKENFNAKSNPILRNISNKISHLALKKIWVEIKRAPEIIDDPKNKCGHYIRTSHGLPCSCEFITRLSHMLPLQLVDIEAFWKTLEIGGHHPSLQEKDMDMDSEMRALTDLLH
ncbi:hypothetical protein M9H77_04451 [Catharanthus roseus]|uniref:Uncharacterized protein n=1 Tax=Catharanthus roseus TaxID=4058 RepID=A0ACC0CEJ0_CATRO|nr:hypothetical protein M9H77_04451 [Catharanthus roseus]